MSCITIPDSGLTLGNFPSTSASRDAPEFLGLSLSDSVIEDMIKCVQNGKPIQLSLGEHPIISYGTKSSKLQTYSDPFTHDIYHTTADMAFYDRNLTRKIPDFSGKIIKMERAGASTNLLGIVGKKMNTYMEKTKAPVKVVSTGDAAMDALANSIAAENAKKAENTTQIVKEGLPIPGKRGLPPMKAKSKLLGQNPRSSMPSSPAMSGIGSPALGPTSIPLSQQQAELAKAARKPVVHLLAVEPMTKKEIQHRVSGVSENDLGNALERVGELKDGKWGLRRNFYKELDVYSYDYKTSDERQRAIDNAVKVYDKMRLSASDPEWDRLLVKSERGTGKSLSKLQASIVSKAPKIHVENADSGRDTPAKEESYLSDRNLSKVKGEGGRASSQEPAIKKKKMTETEAQAKRLLSKNPPKTALKVAAKPVGVTKAAPKTGAKVTPRVPIKKVLPPKATGNGKTLSSEFINESDDDDTSAPPVKPIQKKTMIKRPREEEVDTSDSSVPLSKKIRKDDAPTSAQRSEAPSIHRVSDASQNSRTTNSSQNSNFHKIKSTSPNKSSPLASSPPTNASDDNSPSTSSSVSPIVHGRSQSNSHSHHNGNGVTKHQKSSSVTSSSSTGSGSRYLKPEVTDLARKFKMYYPKYQALHAEIGEILARGGRDRAKEDNLHEMHARLEGMKRDIFAGVQYYD